MTTRTRHGWLASARRSPPTRSGVSERSGPGAADAAVGTARRTRRTRPHRVRIWRGIYIRDQTPPQRVSGSRRDGGPPARLHRERAERDGCQRANEEDRDLPAPVLG